MGGLNFHAALITILFATAVRLALAVKEKPPNILFILADDLGYGEVEGFSSIPLKIQTPCLTRLQEEGMKFTDFYSGEAVCAPARCTLFTGKSTIECIRCQVCSPTSN